MVRPKKHLGQHFLTDLNIAEKVACTLEGKNCSQVIEVGFGKGVLTDFLFSLYDQKVISLDIDDESLTYMHSKYPDRKEQLLLDDILSYTFNSEIKDYAIIGNFPYNISSQIVFKVLDHFEHVKCFAGMFQKEVAERLCAAEGSKTYGILSVLLNTFYKTEYLFNIKPGAFNPPPKVTSAVIYAERRTDFELEVPYKFYKTVVKSAFGKRRKMLSNSLSSLSINKIEDKSYFTLRPEQLSFASFIELSKQLYRVQ